MSDMKFNGLITAEKRWHAIFTRLAQGGLPSDKVVRALQDIYEGRFREEPDAFDWCEQYLLSPADQLKKLEYYNTEYWDGYFNLMHFVMAANLTGGPPSRYQRVTDLHVYNVSFASMEMALEMWGRVFEGELQDVHWGWTQVQEDKLSEIAGQVRLFKPDRPMIELVRINLVSHWVSGERSTVREVRTTAQAMGEELAGLEVLSAYGLHPELFEHQDGETLPCARLASLRVGVEEGPDDTVLILEHNASLDPALWRHSVAGEHAGAASPILLKLWDD